jgi:hypothetical protein
MTPEQALNEIEDKIKRAREPNEPEEEGGEPKAKTVKEVLEILGDPQDCSLCGTVKTCEHCVGRSGDELVGPCLNASRARIKLAEGRAEIDDVLRTWSVSLAVCREILAAKKEEKDKK